MLTPGLSREFDSSGQPDQLHLNPAGLRVFSIAIKNALFLRKRLQERGAGGGAGEGVQLNAGSYSSVVASYRGHHDRRGRGGSRGRRRQS